MMFTSRGGLYAQLLPIAPGNARGGRTQRLIHSAFLRRRKNATRFERATPDAMPRGVAPHNEGCSYRAQHFNQCAFSPQGVALGWAQQLGFQPAPRIFPAAHSAGVLQNAPTFWLLPKGNFSTHSKVERRRIDAKCPEYAAHSR